MSERDIERSVTALWSSAPAQAAAELPVARAYENDPIDRVACRLGDASCASAHASHVARSARADAASPAHGSLLRLQRHYGNRYVGQVLSRAKAGDEMEEVERSIDSARGGGHGLDHRTRGQMEGAFGADFGGVRVHTDARADRLNEQLSARAFATGKDIFFKQGQYDPGSSGGRELLAHELTHVVQQNGDGIRTKMTVSQPDDPQEMEADRMAKAVVQREHEGANVRRQEAPQAEEDEPAVAAKRDPAAVLRQPEAPRAEDEETNKPLQTKHDASATLARQTEEEQQPE